jgi:hypothetical protein
VSAHWYTAFGLTIASDTPIASLPTVATPPGLVPDVRVHAGESSPRLEPPLRLLHRSKEEYPPGTPMLELWESADGGAIAMRYGDGTAFDLTRAGDSVWMRWPEPVLARADAEAYLTGPVLGTLLRLRGILALHGSAIVGARGAVAFLGASGVGKSTLAAAFAARGCPVLADDVVAFQETRGWFVLPAHGQLRVSAEAAALATVAPDALRPLAPTWDKEVLVLSGTSRAGRQVRLDALYLLGPRTPDARGCVDHRSPSRSFLDLVPNTFGVRLGDDSLRNAQFAQLEGLVRAHPPRLLRVGSGAPGLAATVRLVLGGDGAP